MANDKHLRENEDDQLRPDTTNEIIRETHGGPDADISSLNDDSNTRLGGLGSERQDIYGDDATRGTGFNPNDASAVRSGGVADMDDQTAGGAGLAGERPGSGTSITTKRGMSGSDFDGQNATS